MLMPLADGHLIGTFTLLGALLGGLVGGSIAISALVGGRPAAKALLRRLVAWRISLVHRPSWRSSPTRREISAPVRQATPTASANSSCVGWHKVATLRNAPSFSTCSTSCSR